MSLPLKNISEFPKPIQQAVSAYAGRLLENLGNNVIAVMVYGSAAGGSYYHGTSNINMAVVVKDLDFSVLKQSVSMVKAGHKNRIATPLFLTKDYILNALDVFPIEFSAIKEQHVLIFGEDIFKDINIPLDDVRLLCAQQVKGKLLHLRQAYLEAGGNAAVLKNFLTAALNDLMPVFRQLILLKGQKPVESVEAMLQQLAKDFSLDAGVFTAVFRDKHKKTLMAAAHVEAHLQSFLVQLENLSRYLDSL